MIQFLRLNETLISGEFVARFSECKFQFPLNKIILFMIMHHYNVIKVSILRERIY